jgi:hypothetical protein
MRVILAGVGVSVLIACGGQSGADVILDVDPPLEGSCVGVAGFEVTVSPSGQAPQSKKLVGPQPILDPTVCALPGPFMIQDLDLDSPISIDVRGYDGTGTSMRVSASTTLTSLRQSPKHLVLRAEQTRHPLLVLNRNAALQGVPLSDVKTIAISTQMMSTSLLTVASDIAGVFFEPEPAAYGIPMGLRGDGSNSGLALSVNFFAADGTTIARARVTAEWNLSRGYYEARAQ